MYLVEIRRATGCVLCLCVSDAVVCCTWLLPLPVEKLQGISCFSFRVSFFLLGGKRSFEFVACVS